MFVYYTCAKVLSPQSRAATYTCSRTTQTAHIKQKTTAHTYIHTYIHTCKEYIFTHMIPVSVNTYLLHYIPRILIPGKKRQMPYYYAKRIATVHNKLVRTNVHYRCTSTDE